MVSCFDQMDVRISDLDTTIEAIFDKVLKIQVIVDAMQVGRPSSS